MFSDATIYVGGLDDKVTDTLLWELFVQAGSVGNYLSLLFFDVHKFCVPQSNVFQQFKFKFKFKFQ